MSVLFRRAKILWSPILNRTSTTKKTSDSGEAIRRWNLETRILYGPLLKDIKAKPRKMKTSKPADDISKAKRTVKIPPNNNSSGTGNELTVTEELPANLNESSSELSEDHDGVKTHIDKILTFPLCSSFRPAPHVKKETSKVDLNVNAKKMISPSVSKILNATMPPESRAALEKWKQTMIEKLGEDGFQRHQQMLFDQGKKLHDSIEEICLGTPYDKVQVNAVNKGHWKSLEKILPKIRDAIIIENWVAHPFLDYRGIIDCVAVYRDQMVLIDWKTSGRIKSKIEYTYDNPLQIAAYMGALNYDRHYQFQVNKGALVIAYEDGTPGEFFYMDEAMSLKYWLKWLNRLKEFRNLPVLTNIVEA